MMLVREGHVVRVTSMIEQGRVVKVWICIVPRVFHGANPVTPQEVTERN